MENKAEKLVINCGVCDARTLAEGTFSGYEEVTINAGPVLVSRESKDILNRLGVKLNCGTVTECPKDAKTSYVNGKAEIKATDVVPEKTFLVVNGKLTVAPGTQEVLKQYVGIQINGKVICPESVSGVLGMMEINGKAVVYPDEAVVLKNGAAIDWVFALRAKERLYWSEGDLIMVDPKLDPEVLVKKGATFAAQKVIIAERFVEPLIDRIDEEAELVIVPDGTCVVGDDLKLDDLAVKRYGVKLYIDGDLEADAAGREAIEQLQYLNVQGDVCVTEDVKEALMEKLNEIEGEIIVRKGRILRDVISLRITREMLEREAGGVCANGCIDVTLDEDIPNELILERLSFLHCVNVHCTPEQEGAVHMVSEDVIDIGGHGHGDNDRNREDDGDTQFINAGTYVL